MPSSSRESVVRVGEIATYHAYSRTALQKPLLGRDPLGGVDNSFLRARCEELLAYLARIFFLDIASHNFLDNHFHLIARARPDLANAAPDEVVAWKWRMAWCNYDDKQREWYRNPTDAEVEEVLRNPHRLALARRALADISWLVGRFKQSISVEINKAIQSSGTCWQGRFGCRELVDDAGVLACMQYVDLNQVKAGMAGSLEESVHAAIRARLLKHRIDEARKARDELLEIDFGGQALTQEELEKLYVGVAWLAPISMEGPLKLINDAWQGPLAPGKLPEPLPVMPPRTEPSPRFELPPALSLDCDIRDLGVGDLDVDGGDVEGGERPVADMPATEDQERATDATDCPADGPNDFSNCPADGREKNASAGADEDHADGNGEDGSDSPSDADVPFGDPSAEIDDPTKSPGRMAPDAATAAGLADWLPAATLLIRNARTPSAETEETASDAPDAPPLEHGLEPTPSASPRSPSGAGESRDAGGGNAEASMLASSSPAAAGQLESSPWPGTTAPPMDLDNGQADGGHVEFAGGEDGQAADDARSESRRDPAPSPKPKRRSRARSRPRPRRQRRPATYEIHNRLIAGLPMRASNDPILSMPLEQYILLIEGAAGRLADDGPPRGGDGLPPHKLPARMASLLDDFGINSEAWFNTLDHFEDLFHHVVGSPEKVEEFRARTGRETVHGAEACREAFRARPPPAAEDP